MIGSDDSGPRGAGFISCSLANKTCELAALKFVRCQDTQKKRMEDKKIKKNSSAGFIRLLLGQKNVGLLHLCSSFHRQWVSNLGLQIDSRGEPPPKRTFLVMVGIKLNRGTQIARF